MDCVGHLLNTNPCRSRYHVSIVPHLVQLEYLTKEQRIVFWVYTVREKEELLELKMSCSCQDDNMLETLWLALLHRAFAVYWVLCHGFYMN